MRDAARWPLFDVRAAFLPDGRTRLFLGVDVLALDLAGWMQILAEWGDLAKDKSGTQISFGGDKKGAFAVDSQHFA
ncbi:hypothetical protein [Actinomadura sp. 9N215]|uniref:hypothetical protein n=1 Tax=Actinomadura sp. 9N215 TaxID=3375150 RepID=UPI0037A31DD0